MVKPSDIVAALVALLRSIPDLVAEMGGDEERIYGYLDVYPVNVNRRNAIHNMPTPSVMVVYGDWGEDEFGAGQPFSHSVTVYVRPPDGGCYSDLTRLLVYGVPSGQPLPMVNITVLDDLQPMKIEGRCGPDLDAEGVEFCALNVRFLEKWG